LKKLFICGDSFAVADAESSVVPWFEILGKKLAPTWSVTNNSIVCASNLHIRLQIQSAIDQKADFVIFLATASTRGEGRLDDLKISDKNLLNRFVNIGKKTTGDEEFGCYSYYSLDERCVFDAERIDAIRQFRHKIFDLELSTLNNQFIIESSLHALKSSNTAFVFDQGGFENPKFSGSKKGYFKEFNVCQSQINLWSLVDYPMGLRPYFHITEQSTHTHIAEYYFTKIQNCG
jgi:hypothetical protein